MADLVENILKSAEERDSKYKTTEVSKDIELEIDEGNLLAVDRNPIDAKLYRSKKEGFLKDLARDNTQILFNKIWQLPIERVEDAVVAKLPDPKTVLPREKPIPKPRPPTRWEQFAKVKGIKQMKKDRMVWDDTAKAWKPRYGYKRANDEGAEWVLEVPDHADPYEDQFEKRLKNKKEKVAKNELQRLRNIARNMKGKVPGVGLTPTEKPDKYQLSRAMAEAKRSTASVGKFTEDLNKKKLVKKMGKKRKLEDNIGNPSSEKKRQLEMLGTLHKGTPTLDVTKAVNSKLREEDNERSKSKKGRKGGGKAAGGKVAGGKGKGKRKGRPAVGNKGKKKRGKK